jgi:DNA-binding CsgD family transcriptional regulator
LGKAAKGRGGTEGNAIAMASQGFHPSVIAVTLGVQERYINGVLKTARAENRIPEETLGIVHGVASRLRKEHSPAKEPVAKGNDPMVVVKETLDKDDEVSAGTSQTETIREMAARGKTAREIAVAIGTSPMKVINEANKNSIYFYIGDDDRNSVESILFKTEGMK